MSSLADKNLSQSAQDKISAITASAQSGKISWADANKQANAVRASEGANYSVSSSGTTSYNDGSSISSYKSGSTASGGGSAAKTVSSYGGSSSGGSGSSGSSGDTGTSGAATSYNAATDYAALAEQYAAQGDWTGVRDALAQRLAKINAQGGNDRGTSNQTLLDNLTSKYSNGSTPISGDLYTALSGGTVKYDDGTDAYHLDKVWQDGVDYSALAEQYAAQGDWDAVDDALMRRQAKMEATGSTGGGVSNMELWKKLNDQYSGPSAGMSLEDMYAGSLKAYGTTNKWANTSDTSGGTAGIGTTGTTGTALTGTTGTTGITGTTGTGYTTTDNDLAAYLTEMYNANTAANLAALKSTYEQNLADLQAQGEQISDTYAQQKNQAAVQNELQRLQMAETGISSGLNTGATGQMALAQSAALQSTLATLGSQEAQSVSDNSLQQTKLAAAYNNAIDEATAEGNYQLASALYNEYVRQQELAAQQAAAEQEQANWEAEFNASQQQYQDSLTSSNRDYAYTLAMTALQNGIMPDADILETAGISSSTAASLQAIYAGTTGITTTGTTSTSGGSNVSGNTTKKGSGGSSYNNGNLTTSQVKELQSYYGVTADGKWGSKSTSAADGKTADEAWSAYQAQKTQQTGTSFTNSSGVTVTPASYSTITANAEAGNYGPKYGMVLSQVQAKFSQGADAATLSDIISKALADGSINEAGAETIVKALGY